MNNLTRADLLSSKPLPTYQPFIPSTSRVTTEMALSQSACLALAKEESLEYSSKIWVWIHADTKDDWRTQLNIRIQLRAPQSLYIELTDDSEPSFLFIMECTESAFASIKNEQDLRVEFKQFPNTLIDLLESTQRAAEKFACVIQVGQRSEIVLNIVETNRFKMLTHLSLLFRAGDDEMLRECFAKKYQGVKGEYEEALKKLATVEEELRGQININERLKSDLSVQISEHAKAIDAMKLEHQEQLNELKEQMNVELNAAQAKNYSEKQELANQVAELKADCTNLQQAKEKLAETNKNLEASKRELLNKIQAMQHAMEMQEKELQNFKEARVLDENQEKELMELKTKYENAYKQVQDKDLLVEKTNGLYEKCKVQVLQMEEMVAVLKRNGAKMEDKLILSVGEINKGNEIIRKLEGKLKAAKQKMQMQEEIISQYKKAENDSKKLMEEYTISVMELKRDNEHKSEELTSKQQIIEELKKRLEDSKEQPNVQSITVS
eukprot:TRINITY_DN2109_c0_g3_i2.p1 TRINITY_DN2109_c0_g3~~TRINITY_DN2109_c0_g3_i2.p1  ORF type:complete len:523 (+),score=141.37 TRINITY_DN2109_c0_g3_i2:85-1569(+)